MRALSGDPDLPLLCSLEDYDPSSKKAKKAAIFRERTVRPVGRTDKAETHKEALLYSLNARGKVDLDYMGDLLGRDSEEFLPELKGVFFRDPEDLRWKTEDEYLSGNVREKLIVAKRSAESDPAFKENVEALRTVQPENLTFDQIDARLGSSWIPADDVNQFVAHILGVSSVDTTTNYSPEAGVWTVEAGFSTRRGYQATNVWGTDRATAVRLIDDALNLRVTTIHDVDEEGNRWVNMSETASAREMAGKLKERFTQWLWEDDSRRERLTQKYNTEFNSLRLRHYSGEHLTLPGASPHVELRQHQKGGVWRILQNQNTLLAHEVGAGKTFTMVAAAMELRRLKLANKPMMVVPNHMLEQFSSELLELYPNASILVAGKKDFAKDKRKTLFAKIATGSWDAVIVTHSGFGKLPMSSAAQKQFIKKQVGQLGDAIISLRAEGSGTRMVKELENRKKRLETKLKRLSAEGSKDDGVTFEQLGIDRLFVDEAHYFKNLFFATKMTRVAGLPQTASERAFDLYLKTNYLQENGGGVVFATATPIANSIAEMFTMQRYLQPKSLEKLGLSHFDCWAGTFGETVAAMELAPDGSGYRMNTRFARFTNVPELMSLFREVADVQTAEMLGLPVPKLETGKAQIVGAEPSDDLTSIVSSLAKRAEKLKNNNVDPRDDNMLLITNEGRKAALDLRVLDPSYPDVPGSKVNLAVDKVFSIWEDTQEKRLTQMVFCDLSRPAKNDDKFSVYDDIRTKLINRGVPREEIEFIHDHETDKAKLKLFRNVREGKVRVLLGSTQKMGTGTNAQTLLFALHHLDAPWRPADIEQRDGRMLRQGNQNKEVKIFRYVTKSSFDGYMWQTLETKAKFISQVMTGNSTARRVEDLDSPVLSYAEVKAIASGNPLVLEKAQVDAEVMKFSLLESQYHKAKFQAESTQHNLETEISLLETRLGDLQKDNAKLVSTKGDLFRMTLEGMVFTQRKAAGIELERILKRIGGDDFVEVGSVGGLRIETHSFSERDFVLRGEFRYNATVHDTPEGTIQSVESIFRKIPKKIASTKIEIEEAKKELRNFQEAEDHGFEHAEKLNELLVRQKELSDALEVKESETPAVAESDENKVKVVETPNEKTTPTQKVAV